MADDNEHLVGLLKFQPREFMDDVINAVHDYVCDGMDGLEEALTANLPKKYTKNASHKECLRKVSRRTPHSRLPLQPVAAG